ncbi:MAG: phosphopentomutase [Bacilli bacterium]|nr:phosphopentomutase [Bacilli bacterium]
MYNRIFLIVMDSVGIGKCIDQELFNDLGSNTLKSCSESKYFNINTLRKLGIFNIDDIDFETHYPNTIGSYGKCMEKSMGKDTITGHLEMMGIIKEKPFPTYPNGFPKEIIDEFELKTGRKVIVNKPYSGTEVIKDYGKKHLDSGNLIVYTSADSVFQIAAHKDIVSVEELYNYSKIARDILKDGHAVGRVIARPFEGEYPFIRSEERRDFALKPDKNCLDYLYQNNLDVIKVGRIVDMFQGFGTDIKSNTNEECMIKTSELLNKDFKGLAFINFEDFDMLYGHRNNVYGYAKALSSFDSWLETFIDGMRDDDLLIITADHGNDPKTPSTDHSRECTPLLVYNKSTKSNNLGIRDTFADIGKSILDNFNIDNTLNGNSFIGELK